MIHPLIVLPCKAIGNIVTAGQITTGANPSAALIRYLTSGSIDTTFGTSGSATIPAITNANGSSFYVIIKSKVMEK